MRGAEPNARYRVCTRDDAEMDIRSAVKLRIEPGQTVVILLELE